MQAKANRWRPTPQNGGGAHVLIESCAPAAAEQCRAEDASFRPGNKDCKRRNGGEEEKKE